MHVVTKCFLHGGIKVNGPDVCECSFDAPLFSKICKQCYAPHDMLAPPSTRRFHILTDAMPIQKAHRQIPGKLISQFVLVGVLDEVLPNCSISIT